MSWLVKSLLIFVFAFGILVGHTMGRMEWSHSECNDIPEHTAWLSVRDGIYRCFWIQNNYPWRVRLQGVIDVR
jgi:hypothetical protein